MKSMEAFIRRATRVKCVLSLAAATIVAAGLLATAAPTAQADPDWGCTATPLTATLLGAPLDLAALRSNPSEVPCADDDKSILEISEILGLNADVLDSETTTTGGPVPLRHIASRSEVADLGLEADLPLISAPLLTVDEAQSEVTAQCPADDSLLPTLTANSSFTGVRVLGVLINLEDVNVDLSVLGLVRARIIPNYEERTPTSLRRVALRVDLSADGLLATVVGLLGINPKLLAADIADARVSAVDNPCGAPTSGDPPTVNLAPGEKNRELKATVTPATGDDHDQVLACTILARPSGAATPFIPVSTDFDEAAGECSATLDSVTFPGPGAYEAQAVAVDADGDEGTSSPITLDVLAPQVDPPAISSGRTIAADVTPVPGIDIDRCAFVLTPSGGGDPQALTGSYGSEQCSVAVPASVTDGQYDVQVTVVDVNGDSGQNTSASPLSITGNAPTVTFKPGQPNRRVLAEGAAPDGETLTGCTIEVDTGSGYSALASTFDADSGQCTAILPSGSFDPGDYQVRVTVTDSSGDEGTDSTTASVGTPQVGAPTLVSHEGGGDPPEVSHAVTAPVTPAPGTPIVGCEVSVTPQSGGSAVILPGTYDPDDHTCQVALPKGVEPGQYTAQVTATDANGDAGTGSGTITVPQPPVPPPAPEPGPTPTARPAQLTAEPSREPVVRDIFTDGDAGDLALACTDRPVVLTEARRQGRRVVLAGAADPALRGKRVDLVFVATREIVAQPIVSNLGLFRVTVPAPSGKIRKANRMRYEVRGAGRKSPALKLDRRMANAGLSKSRDGKRLTFSGTVRAPRAAKPQTVTIRRMVACGRYQTVTQVRLRRDGSYSATFAVPNDARAAIYRAETRVPARKGGGRLHRTYTLPLPIQLR